MGHHEKSRNILAKIHHILTKFLIFAQNTSLFTKIDFDQIQHFLSPNPSFTIFCHCDFLSQIPHFQSHPSFLPKSIIFDQNNHICPIFVIFSKNTQFMVKTKVNSPKSKIFPKKKKKKKKKK